MIGYEGIWRTALLNFRTIRYLKASQLFYYFRRRFLPSRRPSPVDTPAIRPAATHVEPCRISGIYVSDSTFRFLNVEADLRGAGESAFDWSARDQSRLWRYNLHYFDYVREPERPESNKDFLIESWIASNPPGSQPGWEPFTTSLRIVNWILHLRQRTLETLPQHWLRSLYLQARWLEQNDEKHILANHYFENLKALFFAGCFFAGKDASRWIDRTSREIPRQLSEQTLPDGGHYERSHQYHCLMLENYLDILNLTNACPSLVPDSFVGSVRAAAEAGLRWLSATLLPDGTIPLFNDSAFGVAVSPAGLFACAKRLAISTDPEEKGAVQLIDLPETGLYGCRTRHDMFIIDCGDIGPSYQPGHTHCDFLSYELMLGGRRVVVDTGVFEYEPGPARAYVRSTKAHNTVAVDGDEQSEIWGAFRVARRASRLHASIVASDGKVQFRGAYRGFHRIPGGIAHHRSATVLLTASEGRIDGLAIEDRIEGRGQHTVENFVHFHPEFDLRPAKNNTVDLVAGGDVFASLAWSPGVKCRIEHSFYSPEFGRKIRNHVLVLETTATLPAHLRYELRLATRR